MKVLLVDDEELVRRSLQRAFVAQGHEVDVAEDGLEGLKLWRSSDPDLVLLDVLMPGLSGPQVIREMNGQSRAKIVLMSAYRGEEYYSTGEQGPADLFVEKPFEDIFRLVRELEGLVQ